MPEVSSQRGSEYNQSSFLGGMNLLGDDSRLQPNQYRVGFNLTNRYDVLDPVLSSSKDFAAPPGIKQELVTFGKYVILFVAGKAYYRYYSDTGWKQIPEFGMNPDAPRYWTASIPVADTNYIRIAATNTVQTKNFSSPGDPINVLSVAGASQGNLPGLLVQDNISQPQFIFLDGLGIPTCRVTQSFDEWHITYTDADNIDIAPDGDQREYVPIGNSMVFDDGILYITSPDRGFIYRSVSGRPLDFVVNVTNLLADGTTTPPFTQYGGGDAATTSYSVGVGGITVLRSMSSGGIFVAASNANFNVTKNQTPGAPTLFGEYTFNRKFLFNANCLSDRAIFDTLGDTRFIDLTGVRSFNAVEQTQNEGRNTPFTATVQGAFGSDESPIIQDPTLVAGILYNDYELYALRTTFGPCLAKFDTINQCWSSFDISQTGGKAIKILAKIELDIRRLYAVTEDDQLYALYLGPETDVSSFRTIGVCANILYENTNIRMANPKNEIKLLNTRAVINKITEDYSVSFTPFVNNRLTASKTVSKTRKYSSPSNPSISPTNLLDIDTQLDNLIFPTPNCAQGWKVFGVFTWSSGSFTQCSMELEDLTPMQSLSVQS